MTNNNFCTVTIEKMVKKEGTKTVWVTDSKEVKNIDEQSYNNIVNAKNFMRNLGGRETHQKGYTFKGYKVVKIISTSPDKQNRTIYNFDFDN